MPKRKHGHDDDYESLRKVYKKMKRKLRKRRRRRDEEDSMSSRLSRDCTPELPYSGGSPVMDSEIPIINLDTSETVIEQSGNCNIPTDSNVISNISSRDIENEPAAVPAQPTLEDSCVLDSDILDILGDDPTVTTVYGSDIQNDLAVRLQHIATSGLSKDARKELMDKYLVPDNAKLIDAPVLNAEMKAALTDNVTKRDKVIYHKQKQLVSAISSLSEAISMIISSKNKNPALLKLLMDTGRNLCDIQNGESTTRRNYVLTAVKKDLKEQLKLTKVDSYLFGQNLAETLKSAKAINKSGADLVQHTIPKPPPPRKTFNNAAKNLNSKGPFPARRLPPGAPRTSHTQPAASQRNQPSSSSRPFRPRQQPYSRNQRH